jgi:hypothetical protein
MYRPKQGRETKGGVRTARSRINSCVLRFLC